MTTSVYLRRTDLRWTVRIVRANEQERASPLHRTNCFLQKPREPSEAISASRAERPRAQLPANFLIIRNLSPLPDNHDSSLFVRDKWRSSCLMLQKWKFVWKTLCRVPVRPFVYHWPERSTIWRIHQLVRTFLVIFEGLIGFHGSLDLKKSQF